MKTRLLISTLTLLISLCVSTNMSAQDELIIDGGFEGQTIDARINGTPTDVNWRSSASSNREWKAITGGNPGTYAYSLKSYDIGFLASNKISFADGKTYTLSFDNINMDILTACHVKVALGQSQDKASLSQTLFESDATNGVPDTWTTETTDFTVAGGGDYYIVFIAIGADASNIHLGIDNVSVKENQSTNIDIEKDEKIKVWANKRAINISNNAGQDGMATIYDICGRQIKQVQISAEHNTIELPQVGLYIVKSQIGNNVFTNKVLVK